MQSAQIKDLRLKLDQAVAENSQIRELLLPAMLTTAFSNALSATKTSFTGQAGNRNNSQQYATKTLSLENYDHLSFWQEKMELPTLTSPAGIVRIQGIC